MAESELLPCPFCGGNALQTGYGPFGVSCKVCGAHLGPIYSRSSTAAIAAWNRRAARAPDPSRDGVVEALLPFAKWAQMIDAKAPDSIALTVMIGGEHRMGPASVASLRAALSAIDGTALTPSVEPVEPTPKKHVTVNLTDAEIAALEELVEKQQLTPQQVMIQGLRRYQLFIKGEPDLGPMLPPGFATPSPHKGEPVVFIVHDDPELGDYLTKSSDAAIRSGKRVTPLFASPPPVAEGMVLELNKLFAEMGTTAVDPMWADHVELPKAVLRRWIKTWRPFVTAINQADGAGETNHDRS